MPLPTITPETLEAYTPLFLQLGGGGLIGFAVGYAVKKLFKLLLVVAGLGLLSLLYLSYKGYVAVDWKKIGLTVKGLTEKLIGKGSGWIETLAGNLPFAGAFLVGLALGLKTG